MIYPVHRKKLCHTLGAAAVASALLLPTALAPTAAGQDITTGLLAHWTMDETSGVSAADATGNGYNATSAGSPSWGAGRVEGKTEISSGEYFTVSNQIGAPSSISVAAWVKIDALDTTGADLVNIGDSVFISQSNTGTGPFAGIQFHIRRSNGAFQTVNLNAIYVGTGWHHFAGTFDELGNSLKLFVDGVEVATLTTSEGISYDASKLNTTLGGNVNVAGFNLTGSLDAVRIYNRALSLADIQELYAEGDGGLVARYKFDETSGTTAADSSGNDLEGTYSGTPVVGEIGVHDSSVQLNGSGSADYLQLPPEAIDGLSDASFSFWMKSTRTGAQSILSAAGASSDNEFIIYLENHTTLQIYVKGIAVSWSLESIADDQWHHIAVVMDDSANQVTVYRDGVSLGAQSHGTSGTPLQVSAGGFIIGQEQDCVGGCLDANQIFQGNLDELRIYSRAITAAEVADLYGLIGVWTFDEGTGTTAADSSLKANDAQFNTGTPAWVTGVRGYALEFNGTNDAVTNFDFEPPAQGAVSMWWRSDGPPSGRQRPWGVGGNFEMWQDPDGFVSMDLDTDGFQGGFITDSPLYTPGRWYHIVAQWDSADDSYEIYLDGELHKSGISTWPIEQEVAARLSFGTRTGSSQRFTGAIDEFRVYNRKLEVSAIQALFGLIGHWKLDENVGSLALDSSEQSLDGAYQGGAAPGATGPYPGRGANAAEFTGSSGDKVDLPDMGFDFSSGITLAVWFKVNSLSGSYTDFFSLSNGSLVDDIWFGLHNTSGIEIFLSDTSDGAAYRALIEGAAPESNQWIHAAIVIDSAGNGTIYRDGVPVKSGYVGLPNNNTRMQNGIGETTFRHTLDGDLFDMRIYNRALSGVEIAEIYGLIGYWKLDETSGSIAADSSGAQHYGDIQPGVTLANPGRVDEAADFDGVGYVWIDPTETLDMDDSLAMVAWIQPNSNSAIQHILNKEGEYEIAIFSDGTLRWALANTSPGWAWHNTGQVVPFGSWSHVAVVYDQGVVTSYVNGTEVDVYYGSGSIGDAHTSQNSLQIGAREAYTNLRFFGLLDDVRLYNRPIGPQEVLDVFDEGNAAGIRIIRWVEVR